MSRQPAPPPKESNNGRNEYIPQYISSKPFYVEDLLKDTEYLSHQRAKAEQKDTIDKAKWYERGRKTGPAATKYRKGACENCGSMTHKTRDCLSRPRKTGAKWSGKDIEADEAVEDVKLGWDAKRDRWNGYDVREYDSVVRDFEDMEELRKRTSSADAKRSEGDAEDSGKGNNDDNDNDNNNDDDTRYAEETDMGRNQSTSTRQLRLREDTAKYLLDLNLDSAKYDPKTRSMDTTSRSLNARTGTAAGNTDLASEGFVRPSHDPSSDAAAFERAQRYAWSLQEKPTTDTTSTTGTTGTNQPPPATATATRMHLEANPTASALQHKQHLASQAAQKAQRQAYLAERYGTGTGTSTSASTSTSARKHMVPLAVSTYTTYDPVTGRPMDAGPAPVPKSRYVEDVHPGNHTAVWGSFWREGRWGYACCHGLVRNGYCTGEEGKRAFEEEEARKLGWGLGGKGLEEGQGGGGGGDGDGNGDSLGGRKRKADEEDQDLEGGEREKRSKTEEP